ncbi:MAG: hypothetical protein LLF83_10740 [Methanobacterium sp.]|nr:hypothetical protein [Methanobacterium sp.]
MASILNWEEKINQLKISNPDTYLIFKRIYKYNTDTGSMNIPNSFKDNAISYLGDKSLSNQENLERIEQQKIIKFYNIWTGEGAVFNSLRAKRPGIKAGNRENQLEKLIQDSEENCDFCNPEKFTPSDSFGRVKSEFCITAANLAKYDAYSSLIIFKKHNPLDFNQEELSDYINTAFKWFNRVYEYDRRYKFPFMVWNCLYKAGASQVHGHAQILMTRDFPYAKIENIINTSINYKKQVGKNYFSDLYKLHHSMGLAHSKGEVKIIVSITPLKEKEVLVISPNPPSKSLEAKKVIFKILRNYIDVLGVESFNLSIYCPKYPVNNIPYLIKIIDRGKLFSKTADMGGMELYGSSVASDDPYNIIQHLKEIL